MVGGGASTRSVCSSSVEANVGPRLSLPLPCRTDRMTRSWLYSIVGSWKVNPQESRLEHSASTTTLHSVLALLRMTLLGLSNTTPRRWNAYLLIISTRFVCTALFAVFLTESSADELSLFFYLNFTVSDQRLHQSCSSAGSTE